MGGAHNEKYDAEKDLIIFCQKIKQNKTKMNLLF
jgi:hypothetical protein